MEAVKLNVIAKPRDGREGGRERGRKEGREGGRKGRRKGGRGCRQCSWVKGNN